MTITMRDPNSPFWQAAKACTARVAKLPPWKRGDLSPASAADYNAAQRERMKLRIKLLPGGTMPVRAHPLDSGLDCFARDSASGDWVRVPGLAMEWATESNQREPRRFAAARPIKIPLGFCLQIPPGYEAQLRPKSGLSCAGLQVALGTIDNPYRGELCAIVWSTMPDLVISPGKAICQLVIAPVLVPEIEVVDELGDTDRGSGGFGSSGT